MFINIYETFITVVKPSRDGTKIPPIVNLKSLTDFNRINSNFWIGSGAKYHDVLNLSI